MSHWKVSNIAFLFSLRSCPKTSFELDSGQLSSQAELNRSFKGLSRVEPIQARQNNRARLKLSSDCYSLLRVCVFFDLTFEVMLVIIAVLWLINGATEGWDYISMWWRLWWGVRMFGCWMWWRWCGAVWWDCGAPLLCALCVEQPTIGACTTLPGVVQDLYTYTSIQQTWKKWLFVPRQKLRVQKCSPERVKSTFSKIATIDISSWVVL